MSRWDELSEAQRLRARESLGILRAALRALDMLESELGELSGETTRSELAPVAGVLDSVMGGVRRSRDDLQGCARLLTALGQVRAERAP